MRILFNIFLIILGIAVIFSIGIILTGFYLSPQDNLESADAVVVISGGETDTRTVEGIKLYLDGYAPRIVFSGDALDPGSPSNALIMKDLAIQKFGVPEADIIIEEEAMSTYENAQHLKTVFEINNIKSIILVTSPYHQRRSKLTFQNVMGPDFKIINHSSTDEFWRKIAWWQNDRALSLTLSELWKILYIQLTGKYA